MKTITFILTFLISLSVSGFSQFANSLYSDVKGFKVGDILSVIIVETLDASRESKSSSASKAGMSTGASVSGDVTKLVPSFGVSTNYDDSYAGAEGTEQSESLSGRISVKIVEKTESGIFKIEGERSIEVNGEEHVTTLTGFVRPRDIMADNTVYSYNIADLVVANNKGNFSDQIAPQGTFPKLLSGLLGLAVLAVAGGLLVL